MNYYNGVRRIDVEGGPTAHLGIETGVITLTASDRHVMMTSLAATRDELYKKIGNKPTADQLADISLYMKLTQMLLVLQELKF